MTGKGRTKHVDSNGCRNKGTIQMYKPSKGKRQTDGYVNQTMDETTDKGHNDTKLEQGIVIVPVIAKDPNG